MIPQTEANKILISPCFCQLVVLVPCSEDKQTQSRALHSKWIFVCLACRGVGRNSEEFGNHTRRLLSLRGWHHWVWSILFMELWKLGPPLQVHSPGPPALGGQSGSDTAHKLGLGVLCLKPSSSSETLNLTREGRFSKGPCFPVRLISDCF